MVESDKAIFNRSADHAFEELARREPYHAILTSPRFLSRALDATAERDFFASGEELVSALFEVIRLRLAPHFAPTAILDYGCGIGRLAIPLAQRAARRSGRVVAVDWSRAMLDRARRHAAAHDVENVEFLLATEFAARDELHDLVMCYLVLQGMSRRDGLALVRALLQRTAPGGICVFQLPYSTRVSALTRAIRFGRARSAAINLVANVLQRRPAGQRFVRSEVYDLRAVLSVLEDAGIEQFFAVFDDHGDLRSATVLAEMPLRKSLPDTVVATHPVNEAASIDVRALIASSSVDALNAAADDYYRNLPHPENQLSKPFAETSEAPAMLADVATLLHVLEIAPGMTVLDFGCGTGWLARWLTQLGARVIAVDVSQTALDLARRHYGDQPVYGTRPPPAFLRFDGHALELPDESVDRALCFHALHHVPNLNAIVAELARVLRPGGIAAFAEPGPHHSASPQSQFEMRTTGVVENDIDVHAIWQVAQDAGFRDIRIAAWNNAPLLLPLAEFEQFLAGGGVTGQWVASTREFLRNVRTFVLVKDGVEVLDSRRTAGLRCEINAAMPERISERYELDVTVTNTGTAVWLGSGVRPGGVSIGAHLYAVDGQPMQLDWFTDSLGGSDERVLPGQIVRRRLVLPDLPPGRYLVELDCVAADVTWFSQIGSAPARCQLEVVQEGT